MRIAEIRVLAVQYLTRIVAIAGILFLFAVPQKLGAGEQTLPDRIAGVWSDQLTGTVMRIYRWKYPDAVARVKIEKEDD